MKLFAGLALLALSVSAEPLTLATFDGAKTEFKWYEEVSSTRTS